MGPAGTRGDSEVHSRRRGTELEAALLQAAYAQLTMEGVASRAATSKSVLYRRWPNREALVLAAMRRLFVPISSQIPETGTLHGDVVGVLRQLQRRYGEVGTDILQDC